MGVYAAVRYNALVRLRNAVDNAWAQIDVELQQRHDLVPNVVEAVERYASHERGTFERVAEARTAAKAATTVPEQAQAESVLTQALHGLFAVAESYPELHASENYQQLQKQLADIEGTIAYERQTYNDRVTALNTRIETIPTNVVAWFFNFELQPYFEILGSAREVPSVATVANERIVSGPAGATQP